MSAAAVHVIEDSRGAAALLHPLRLRILRELREPDSAAGLGRRIGVPRQQLNYHMRQLESEGLVEVVAERKKRNCTERLVRAVAHSYLISPAVLGSLGADPDRVPDRVSSAYLVAVAARAIRELAALRDRADREGKQIPTLTLQADVRFASPEAQGAFAEELSGALAALVAKYHDERAEGGRAFRVMGGAYPAPADAAPTPPDEERA